jgi:hypothetical protein
MHESPGGGIEGGSIEGRVIDRSRRSPSSGTGFRPLASELQWIVRQFRVA